MMFNDQLPPCPCVQRLASEHVKNKLVEVERSAPLMQVLKTKAKSVESKKSKTIKVQVNPAAEFFKTCAMCAEVKGATGGASKSAGGGKNKNAGKKDSKKDAAASSSSLYPGGWICLTCLKPCCENHSHGHYFDAQPAATGKKKKKSKTLGTHCVYLKFSESDENTMVMYCHHCQMACGNGFVYDEDLIEDYAEGVPVTADGYAVDADGVLGTELEKISQLIRGAMGGHFPHLARNDEDDDDDGKKRKKKKRLGETAEEREERTRRKREHARLLGQAGIMGLTNLGNTCFFNATVQCLLRNSGFTDYLRAIVPTSERPGPLTGALASFAGKYANYRDAGNATMIQPKGLFGQLCQINCMFAEYGQQDAHELFSCIVNAVADEYELKKRQAECPVQNYWAGSATTSITCSVCRTVSSRQEPFYELQVSVGKADNQLELLIAQALEPEILTGDNAFACEKCCAAEFEAKKRQAELEKAQRLAQIRGLAATTVDDTAFDSSEEDDDEEDEEGQEGEETADGDDAVSTSRTPPPTPPPVRESPVEEQQTSTPPPADVSADDKTVNGQAETTAAAPVHVDPMDAVTEKVNTPEEVVEVVEEVKKVDQPPKRRIRGLDAGEELSGPGQNQPTTTPTKKPESAPPTAVASSPTPSSTGKAHLVEATLQRILNRVGAGLVIHMKRFTLNMRLFQWEKNNATVAYPQTLDMSMFVTPQEAPAATATPPPAAPAKPTYPPAVHALKKKHPKVSLKAISGLLLEMCAGSEEMADELLGDGIVLPSWGEEEEEVEEAPTPTPPAAAAAPPPPSYTLVGIVEHRGSVHGGHYVAFVKDRPANRWYLCNDSVVESVSESQAMNAQAYLLFYERSDSYVPLAQ